MFLNQITVEAGKAPHLTPTSWHPWPSVVKDLTPPHWLIEHHLWVHVPHNFESEHYTYKLKILLTQHHRDFVVQQYYCNSRPCNHKGQSHNHQHWCFPPMTPPLDLPPNRAIGCQLPEWIVELNPNMSPLAVSTLDLLV